MQQKFCRKNKKYVIIARLTLTYRCDAWIITNIMVRNMENICEAELDAVQEIGQADITK